MILVIAIYVFVFTHMIAWLLSASYPFTKNSKLYSVATGIVASLHLLSVAWIKANQTPGYHEFLTFVPIHNNASLVINLDPIINIEMFWEWVIVILCLWALIDLAARLLYKVRRK